MSKIFPQLPLTLACAAIFALVMGIMYALVGLYRPGTISLGATVGRITLAMVVGGYLTHLAMRAVGVPESLATLILTLFYLCIGLLLVPPMAVSLCRLTSPVQYAVSAQLIAWAQGIHLSAAAPCPGAALAVVISLGSVGLPGQVTFIATNLPVAQAMGLPLSPLGLMLAVDTIPDALATLGNVTADVTAASVVTRQSRRDAA